MPGFDLSFALFIIVIFLFVAAVVLMIMAIVLRFIFRINDIVAEQRRTNALLESLINQPDPASLPKSDHVHE